MTIGMFDMHDTIQREGLTSYFLYHRELILDLLPKRNQSVFLGSQFGFILEYDQKQRGRMGELFVEMLAKDLGFYVEKSGKGHGDTKINGFHVEVKFARQSENCGFLVNQIRDQDYAYIVLVVMTPHKIELYTVPKSAMMLLDNVKGQHGGKEAIETKIYRPSNLHQIWNELGEYAGLDVFYRTFRVVP